MDDSGEEVTGTETAPPSPGEILRRRREARKLSLEEAAEATSISKTYLRALEGDRFHDLPNPVYIKGFLKIYANYLGLQADDLLGMLTDTVVADAADEQVEAMPKKRAGQQWVQRFALPLVLLGALIFSAVILQPTGNNTVRKPEPVVQQQVQPIPQQAIQPASSSSTAVAVTPPVAPPVVGTPPPANTAEEPAPPPSKQPGKGFVVRMKVLKNGTLTVTIDDTVSQNYQLNAGDLIEWKASASLAMDLSDAGGVEFELNGKPLKHHGVSGKSSHLVLGAEGIRR